MRVKGLLHREQGLTLRTRSPASMRMLGPRGPVCACRVVERFLALTGQAGCYSSLVYFHRNPFAFLRWPPCHGLRPSSGTIYVAEVGAAPEGKASEGQMGYAKATFPPFLIRRVLYDQVSLFIPVMVFIF